MHFLHPIPEPQVTKPELLQENKNDIVGNKTLTLWKINGHVQEILQGTWSK